MSLTSCGRGRSLAAKSLQLGIQVETRLLPGSEVFDRAAAQPPGAGASGASTVRAAWISSSETRPSTLARWPMTRKVVSKKTCWRSGPRSGPARAWSPRAASIELVAEQHTEPAEYQPGQPAKPAAEQQARIPPTICRSASRVLLRMRACAHHRYNNFFFPRAEGYTKPHMADALFESRLTSLERISQGKVRDIYALDEHHLLIVAYRPAVGLRRGPAGPDSRQGRCADQPVQFLVRAHRATSFRITWPP